MKNIRLKQLFGTSTIAALATGALLLCTANVRATNFAGNGSGDWGGSVGNGTLSVTDDGTNITFTIIPTGGNFGGNGVALYIDTGTGGFTSTAGFQDGHDGGRSVVSGYSGSGQSIMTFTNGFKPAYAISFGNTSSDYTSLFQLVTGGDNSLAWLAGTGTSTHTLTFPAATLGLTPGVTANIRIFGSLIGTSGYRSSEAIAGNDVGVDGWNPFTQTAYATYIFAPAVVVTNWVTFQVDMTEQIALGNFNPGNGDTVYAAGSFQATPWSGFQLTNNTAAANTNIYLGSYPDVNLAGTVEQYKFNINNGGTWETITTLNNRSFTLQSGGQVLGPVYFSNVPASPSATTNTITFQIDMGPQIYLGNFNAGNGDQIEVFGSFQGSPWSAGFILTNNPNITQSNIYSGSFTDGNYPGTQYQYKYVVVSGANNSYETTPNRNLVTPAGAVTLPLAYFNNASNVYATPVTFQVDMTAPIASGILVPANGDTVSAAGTFQSSLAANQWKAGTFVLSPTAANTNIYTGTFIDANAPGSSEQFKFQINPAGNGASANWESVANRLFTLGSTAQTNPLVYWNNLDPNNVLLGSTMITFTVNMTNAVDDFGYPFNPTTDAVVVNGDFMNPTWPNLWIDANLGTLDYSGNVLQNDGTDLLYTGTFTVAAGNSLAVQYKYGIIHNYTGYANTNCDNEAGYGQNHTRYIRATGTYSFPVDIFGSQTNAAAATEPSVGSLGIGSPAGGNLPLSWLGRPGVYLEYTTNLVAGPWVQLSATSGTNAFSWPQTNGTAFFRLVNP